MTDWWAINKSRWLNHHYLTFKYHFIQSFLNGISLMNQLKVMRVAATGRRNEGSSPGPAQSSVTLEVTGPTHLDHLDLSVLSLKIFENKMYNEITRKFILRQSRGVLTARDWNGKESLVLHRVLLAEFYTCTEIWTKNCTLEIGKGPNLDPVTLLSISPDCGLWSEPFHFVSLLWERVVFCVITKLDRLQI